MTTTPPMDTQEDRAEDGERRAPGAAPGVDEVRALGRRIVQRAREHQIQEAMTELRVQHVDAFDASLERLEKGRLVIAVMGQQGMGKSTLLSALVGRRVLPIDELETTNVPCRLIGVDDEGERTEVVFSDGSVERGPASPEFIGRFSDEQRNPKNERGVAEIRVYIDAPLLSAGVELVDTPGVGSLTEHTQRVTYEFLSQVSLALFVVPTAPTLRASEARFLSAIYRHVRQFVFVQNTWALETSADVEEGYEDNLRKLREIAGRHGVQDVELLRVNIHAALEAVANDRPELGQSSGLVELSRSLEQRLARGAAPLLVEAEVAVLAGHSSAAARVAQQRRRELKKKGAAGAEEHRRATERHEQGLRETRAAWEEKKSIFHGAVEAAVSEHEVELQNALAEARAHVEPLVHKRKLSGEQLSEALQERVAVGLEQVTDGLNERYSDAIVALREAAVEAAEAAQFGQDDPFEADVDAAGEWETFEFIGDKAKTVGGIGAGFLAFEATMAAGGALLAGEGLAGAVTAIGGLLSTVPVAGWIIGGVLLVGGGALAYGARQKAVRKVMRAVDAYLADVSAKVLPKTRDGVRAQAKRAVAILERAVQAEVEGGREVMQQMAADHEKSDAEREAEAERIRGLFARLTDFARDLSQVLDEISPDRGAPSAAQEVT